MAERRVVRYGRRKSDWTSDCPLTEYQALDIIRRLDSIEPKIDLIYNKLIGAKAVLGTCVFLLVLYSFTSGKINARDLWEVVRTFL